MRDKIKEHLREIIYETWMTEEDYQEIIEETSQVFGGIGPMYAKLEADVEVGIQNGYSFEQQMEILKKYLSQHK